MRGAFFSILFCEESVKNLCVERCFVFSMGVCKSIERMREIMEGEGFCREEAEFPGFNASFPLF